MQGLNAPDSSNQEAEYAKELVREQFNALEPAVAAAPDQ